MKKLILVFTIFIGLSSVNIAQTPVPPVKKQGDKMKAVPTKPASVAPMHKHKANTFSVADKSKPVKTEPLVVLKKDGTPDKRYKNNKRGR